MGQDIAEYGGAFKITEGFVEKKKKEESLCEAAIVGSGLGLSINGYKSMVEMHCRFCNRKGSIKSSIIWQNPLQMEPKC